MTKYRLGIINDEVSTDFAETCRLVREWGLNDLELRVVYGKNILLLDDAELEQAAAVVKEHGLNVAGISSPVFKSPLDGKPLDREADFSLPGVESPEAQLELLERACTVAKLFGTRLVRIFSFWREEWTDAVDAALVARFREAAELARRHDVLLAIENEPVCIAGSGAELGRLWKLLGSELEPGLLAHLGLLWDPGNARALGEERAFPDGFAAVAGPGLVHVHVKDLVFTEEGSVRFVPTGEGLLDYAGQFRALQETGYTGTIVLEPHYQPAGQADPEAAFECVEATRNILSGLGLLA